MREILFRGKTTDRGEWVQGCYTETLRYNNLHWIWNGKNHFTVNPETVGQYTGLTDKNGTKIFEGDIIETKNGVYACFWDSCNFEFGVDNKKESFGIAYVPIKGLKVIGNIHDNPELLKELGK